MDDLFGDLTAHDNTPFLFGAADALLDPFVHDGIPGLQ